MKKSELREIIRTEIWAHQRESMFRKDAEEFIGEVLKKLHIDVTEFPEYKQSIDNLISDLESMLDRAYNEGIQDNR